MASPSVTIQIVSRIKVLRLYLKSEQRLDVSLGSTAHHLLDLNTLVEQKPGRQFHAITRSTSLAIGKLDF